MELLRLELDFLPRWKGWQDRVRGDGCGRNASSMHLGLP
jgi:hypothetical protein